ncbi:hypothetical protein, partial [Escherichia coli]|uniref:hypothetical protein n=1 Tax=Escherichia coli TaxID=562 RepID=UPI003F668BAB
LVFVDIFFCFFVVSKLFFLFQYLIFCCFFSFIFFFLFESWWFVLLHGAGYMVDINRALALF